MTRKLRPGSVARWINPRAWMALLGLVACLWMDAAADAASLAAHLLSKSVHTTGGICAVPSAGDGALAAQLAHQSGLVVHAMCATDGELPTVHGAADGVGLLGKRIFVERGTPNAIPIADNYVDLLVMTDVGDGDLSSLRQAEILRVLAPINGIAVIGKAGGSGLSQSALQTWANGFGVPSVQVVSDAEGMWAIVRKPKLRGSDDWSHRFHEADNNPVSNDSVFGYPYLTQWMAKPYHSVGRREEVAAANGRLFIMSRKASTWASWRENIFHAMNVYNGELLWRRLLPLKYITAPGTMVAYGDTLMMVLGNGVACLDGATGEEIARIAFDGLQVRCKRLAISGNVLVVAAGGAELSTDFPPATVTGSEIHANSLEWSWNCTDIAAYDLSTGSNLWHHTESSPFDLRMFAVRDGKVYFYARNSRAAALDLRGGSLTWQNTNSAFLEAAEWDTSFNYGIMPEQHALVAHRDVVVLGAGHSYNFVGLSTTDGHMLWSIPRTGRHDINRSPLPTFILGNEFWNQGKVYSVLTGDSLRTESVRQTGCGTMTAGPKLIYSQCGLSWDRTSRTSIAGGHITGMHKPQCSTGGIVSNGVHVTSSGPCTCPMPTRGYKAITSADGFTFNRTAVQSERLEQASNYGSVQSLTVESTDWPALRGGTAHTGGSTASVSSNPNNIAYFAPNVAYHNGSSSTVYAVDHRPTPPVTVGDYTFITGSDGKVRCIETASGTLKWRFVAGAGILQSPTVWNGRVYVGSMDGYVYCLEALTGRRLWRFRAAPAERRIVFYGQLSSTWPVLSGVVVHDGVAYAAAGYGSEDGAHVYALDAISGAIKWQNNAIGHRESLPLMGRGPRGGMTIAGGKLWLRTAKAATCAFNLSDGTLVPASLDWDGGGHSRKMQGALGWQIGVFRGRYILHGGQRFFSDHSEREGSEMKLARWMDMRFMRLDGQGTPMYPEVGPFIPQHSQQVPSWDNEVMAVLMYDLRELAGWSVPKLETFLDSCQNEDADSSFPFYRASVVAGLPDRGYDTVSVPMKLWGPLDLNVNAMAVAANAIIVAHGTDMAGPPYEKAPTNWKLAALNKQTGSEIWSRDLPSEPIFDGLAVDRHGNIVVALRNGSVLVYGDGNPVSAVASRSPEAPRAPAPPLGPVNVRAFDGDVTPDAVSSETAQTRAPDASGGRTAVQSVRSSVTSTLGALELLPEMTSREEARAARSEEPPLETVPPECASLKYRKESEQEKARALYRPADMHWYPDRPCLPVAEVSASSADSLHQASGAIDRDLRSRWTPAAADGDQWLVLDMGQSVEADAVSLVWHARKTVEIPLVIEMSSDGTEFSSCDRVTLHDRGTHTTLRTFLAEPARFVRIRMDDAARKAGLTIFEVGVHGNQDDVAVRDDR